MFNIAFLFGFVFGVLATLTIEMVLTLIVLIAVVKHQKKDGEEEDS